MKDELEQVILRWWHDEKLEVKDLSVAIRAWIKNRMEGFTSIEANAIRKALGLEDR